ncbi:MAG: GNAT family N-acetyltransferase [Phycisphaerales bacterium]|nr:MAG: GNAT family N-acetyltransferase [Phycisphaerales bacterium]
MELTRFRAKDVTELLSWIETESDMVRWAGAAFCWPLTARQFRRHLLAAALGPPTLYPFGLYDGEAIRGYCELADYRRQAGSAMLARVMVRPDERRRGWGQFMVRAAVAFGFEQLGLHRIGLGVFDCNDTAQRCYRRVGFTKEGLLRDSAQVNGAYWSCHVMSILRHEWQQNGAADDRS